MLEFAVSLVGLVSLIVISLNVWQWMGRMLVERQGSFQSTRKEAGSVKPGERVPYQRPPIKLRMAGSIGGDGTSSEVPIPADSDCPAGKPFFDQARALYQEGTALKAQSDTEAQRADTFAKKIFDPDHPRAGFKYQIEQCDSDDDDCLKHWSDLIKAALDQAKHHTRNAKNLDTQASQKFEDAQKAKEAGDNLCKPPEPPPSTD